MSIRRLCVRLLLLPLLLGMFPTAANAQTDGLFFPATGHTLTNQYGFLTFWQTRGAEPIFGLPISEPFELDGRPIQYFERARFERIVTPEGRVKVISGPVGREYLDALMRRFRDEPTVLSGESLAFAETGFSLREPFLRFWRAHGGLEVFGAPLSPPTWEQTALGQRQVQYFERAQLEYDPAAAGTSLAVQVSRLGQTLALMRQINLDPVANPDLAVSGPEPTPAAEQGPLVPPTPTPAPTPIPVIQPTAVPQAQSAPRVFGGTRSVLVNLSHQWLYAYEGGQLVFSSPVTTGRDGMNTPTGTYAVYAKLPVQTMRGVENGVPWVVPNVPHVMYIVGGVAIHGTYWHNLFGSGVRVSHGCINLPLGAAAWMYNWAGVGTPVTVTY